MANEAEILAEAERGEVVCVLYKVVGGRLGVEDAEGMAKDTLCQALCDRGLLRFHGWTGQRTSPFGMVSKWIKA